MPQGTAFKRCLSTSSLGLIISGFCVALLVQVALAQPPIQPPPLSAAPVNPVFVAWQSKMATFGVETYNEEGYALGYIPSPIDRSHLESQTETALQTLSTPVSYDLRSSGDVTGVRDQGGCGSCWSFGSYGSLESWLLRNESESWDFSENHMKNYHDFDWGPCEGGNADMSTAYLARWSGPVDESDDPYQDWDDRPSPGGPTQKYLKNVLWFFTDSDIKDAVMTYGALYVTMRYESGSYNSSEYTYYYSGSDSTNHAVTVVGWDDEKVVTGAPGNGAWLIKNSWGTGWGDNGYFWISYYDTKAVLYGVAFCDAVPVSAYTANYQYDPLGWTIQTGYDSPTAWAANVFTTTADEDLQAVALYAVDDNVSYEIYIYDDFDGSGFSNLLGSTSGTLVNLGYHTISLPFVIGLTNGDDFSIVVKFTTTGYGFPIPTEDYFADYSSGATANAGESYVSSTGSTFADITDTFPNANVCIKGLTVPPPMTPPVITSIPVTVATVGELYSYDVNASGYPPPTYALTTYPSGMTIDPNTGLIEWTPGTTGDFDVEVKASNGQAPDANQGFTITVSEPPLYVDDVANADIAVQGSISGSYTDTQSSNDGYEAITEVREGNPGTGYSLLQHKWTINVTGGDTVTFYVEAYQTASSDGDNFVFAYSTDDSNYTDMLTVSKTGDDDTAQNYELPSSLSGTVYIRVVDTDSGKGNQDMDTLYIDHLYIRSASDSPITYTLTVNIVGNGSVTKSPDQATYTYGTVVDVNAIADAGWTFDTWSEDLTGSTNPDSITMDGDKTITATFTEDQYTLTITTVGNGSVTKSPDQATYTYGTVVDVNAIADAGWTFGSWSGDLTGSTNPDTITITGNANVTAGYTQNEYTMTIISDNGTVAKVPDQATYHYNDTVELTATADAGWTFGSWSGDLTGTDNPDTITITGNANVTAGYTQNEYTLTITSDNGTVAKVPDQATYHYNDTVELTATANAGWTFGSWSGDLTSSTNPDTITITGNANVTAGYTQNEYTLTITSDNGTVAKVPDQATYHYNDTVELTATADAGWTFGAWSGDLTSSTNPELLTVTDNMSVTALFTQLQYTITASADANGTIDPNGDVVKAYGQDQQFIATPNIGYAINTWYLDGNSVQVGGTSYMLNNITANHTVGVTFELLEYIISGYVVEPDGNTAVAEVLVSTDDANSVTDVNGYYELWVDYSWSGTVTPEKEGYTFEPNSIDYNNVTTDQNDNYTAILDTFFIDGYVFDSDMVTPLDGVLVSPDNNGGPFTSKYYGGSDITDANGYYEVLVDYNFSGKVVPAKYAYVFEPNSMTYANVVADYNDQDYTGTLMTFTVSGYIKNVCEVPIKGVLMDANNGGGSDTTDANGYYEVWVDYNWSGSVTPNKIHYTFDPNSNAYAYVLDDVIDQNYTATNIYDLDCDGSIGLGDVMIISENWLDGPDLPGDFYKDEDDIVNFLDFADFANVWGD